MCVSLYLVLRQQWNAFCSTRLGRPESSLKALYGCMLYLTSSREAGLDLEVLGSAVLIGKTRRPDKIDYNEQTLRRRLII